MSIKSLMAISCFLLMGDYAQSQVPFNDKIPDANYSLIYPYTGNGWSDGSYRKTITQDSKKNIYFLNASPNDLTNANYDFSIVKLNSNGTFNNALRIKNIAYQLFPKCIVPCFDGNLLVVGDYLGTAPAGYPVTGTISTVFFAKISPSLGIVDWRLFYGYPVNIGSLFKCLV